MRSAILAATLLLAGCAQPVEYDPDETTREVMAKFAALEEAKRWADQTDAGNLSALNTSWWIMVRPLPAEHLLFEQHTGYIWACVPFLNENVRDVVAEWRAEIVHLPNDGREPQVVASMGHGPDLFLRVPGVLAKLVYNVNLSTSIEDRGRSQYQLHYWNEIFGPERFDWNASREANLAAAKPFDPPLRAETWHSFTYEPFQDSAEGDREEC